MDLKAVAQTTLQALETGSFVSESGKRVNFSHQMAAAVASTRAYSPEQAQALVDALTAAHGTVRVSVTDEDTGSAARRLAAQGHRVAALNFASARNAGGGFVRGARAQEEDLARCSALYACLTSPAAQPYYSTNRAEESMLYTDWAEVSDEVPFFRDAAYRFLDSVSVVGVVTSPAPNAGQALARKVPKSDIEQTLARRLRQVLALWVHHRYRVVVLGAWGCGVFKNDPQFVAQAFSEALRTPRFEGAFDEVCFAIYDRSAERRTLAAFLNQFEQLPKV